MLRGVKPADGEKWQDYERDGAVLVPDVICETIFWFKNVDGVISIDLEDMEGNDVAQLLVVLLWMQLKVS